METNQNISIPTVIFFLSRLFERMAYYGLRGIIILYMVSELSMETSQAGSIYGWIAGGLIVSGLFGALLGDLLIGNKTCMIVGGILQIIGALLFLIPNTTGLYIGLFMIVLGTGFYVPNITSQFGKLYLAKPKLLDTAFTGLYLAINIGSFFGVLLTGWISQELGYDYGFVFVSLILSLSLLFSILSKDTKKFNFELKAIKIETRIIKIIVAIVLVALFWSIYQISSARLFDIQYALKPLFSDTLSNGFWNSLTTIGLFPIAIIMIVLWSFIYNSQFIKLAIGFIFATISFAILFFIPEVPEQNHLALYILSIVLFSIAEIHIAPIVHSVLTQYAKPKYLAILISLSFAPTRLLGLALGYFNDGLYNNQSFALILCTVMAGLIGLGLLIFIILNRKLKLISN